MADGAVVDGASKSSGLNSLQERILESKMIPAHVKQELRERFERPVDEVEREDRARAREVEEQRHRAVRVDYQKHLMARSGVGSGKTLENYKPQTRLQRAAVERMRSWVTGDREQGLLFVGPTGRGKSHLIRGGIAALYSMDPMLPIPSCLYYYLPEIERLLLRERRGGEDAESLEWRMRMADVLGLDDVSKLDPMLHQGWFLNIVGTIVDLVDREGRPYVLSSVQTRETEPVPENHDGLIRVVESVVGPKLGVAFVGRLVDACELVPVDGPNWRTHPVEETVEPPHWVTGGQS